ncbi:MAG: hypothetical protein EAZ95_07150 [Bacteroidetes bacterium]|nr:MAG: hypothetical protein EAZ95_07150 [Bacteroidota bacterium]
MKKQHFTRKIFYTFHYFYLWFVSSQTTLNNFFLLTTHSASGLWGHKPRQVFFCKKNYEQEKYFTPSFVPHKIYIFACF